MHFLTGVCAIIGGIFTGGYRHVSSSQQSLKHLKTKLFPFKLHVGVTNLKINVHSTNLYDMGFMVDCNNNKAA